DHCWPYSGSLGVDAACSRTGAVARSTAGSALMAVRLASSELTGTSTTRMRSWLTSRPAFVSLAVARSMSDALADGLNLTITGTVGAFGSIVGVPVNLALGVSVADGSPAAVDVADVSAPGVPV